MGVSKLFACEYDVLTLSMIQDYSSRAGSEGNLESHGRESRGGIQEDDHVRKLGLRRRGHCEEYEEDHQGKYFTLIQAGQEATQCYSPVWALRSSRTCILAQGKGLPDRRRRAPYKPCEFIWYDSGFGTDPLR